MKQPERTPHALLLIAHLKRKFVPASRSVGFCTSFRSRICSGDLSEVDTERRQANSRRYYGAKEWHHVIHFRVVTVEIYKNLARDKLSSRDLRIQPHF